MKTRRVKLKNLFFKLFKKVDLRNQSNLEETDKKSKFDDTVKNQVNVPLMSETKKVGTRSSTSKNYRNSKIEYEEFYKFIKKTIIKNHVYIVQSGIETSKFDFIWSTKFIENDTIFGVFNARDVKIEGPNYGVERNIVDIILPINLEECLLVKDINYFKNPGEPIIYYKNKISGKVLPLKDNEYSIEEIDYYVVGFTKVIFEESKAKLNYIILSGVKINFDQNFDTHFYEYFTHGFFKEDFDFGFTARIDKLWFKYRFSINELEESELLGVYRNIADIDPEVNINKNYILQDSILFHFTITNDLVSRIILAFIGQKSLKFEIARNIILNDYSQNIVVTVQKEDIESIVFFYYIKIKKKPPSISFLGLEIHRYFYVDRNKYILFSELLFEKFKVNSLVDLEDRIVDFYGVGNVYQGIAYHNNLKNINNYILFQYLKSFYKYKDDDEFHNSKIFDENRNYYQKKYSSIKNSLSYSLVSEKDLFDMIKFYFPTSIYQYTLNLSKLLIIDIFIPELGLGIEFQGAQHYSKRFGKTAYLDNFIKQVKSDEEKKKIANDKNIKLLDWRYDIEINFWNLNKLLRENGFDEIKLYVNKTPSTIGTDK